MSFFTFSLIYLCKLESQKVFVHFTDEHHSTVQHSIFCVIQSSAASPNENLTVVKAGFKGQCLTVVGRPDNGNGNSSSCASRGFSSQSCLNLKQAREICNIYLLYYTKHDRRPCMSFSKTVGRGATLTPKYAYKCMCGEDVSIRQST